MINQAIVDTRQTPIVLKEGSLVFFVDQEQNKLFYIDSDNTLRFVSLSSILPSALPQFFCYNGISKQFVARQDIEAPPGGGADYTFLVWRSTTNSWTYNTLSNITPQQIQNGTQNYVLTSGIVSPLWSLIQEASLADACVTSDKINDGAVISSKLASNSVSNSKIASQQVTADKIANSTITNVQISTSANIAVNKLEKNTDTAPGTQRKLLLFNSNGGGVNQLVEPGLAAIYAYPDSGQLYGNVAFQFSYMRDQSIYASRNTGDVTTWGNTTTGLYPYSCWSNYGSADTYKYFFPILFGASNIDNPAGSNLYGPTISYYTGSNVQTPQVTQSSQYTQLAYTINGSWVLGSDMNSKLPFKQEERTREKRQQMRKLRLGFFKRKQFKGADSEFGSTAQELSQMCCCPEKNRSSCECLAHAAHIDKRLDSHIGINYTELSLLMIDQLRAENEEQEQRIEKLEKMVEQLLIQKKK